MAAGLRWRHLIAYSCLLLVVSESLSAAAAVERQEFRAAWVATVANIDWPSSAALPTAEAQAELLRILDLTAQLRMNAVVLQVRPSADAFYLSDLEPWSEYLTGASGVAPDPLWDPLAFCAEEAHDRGIELHAWFNPYRANLRPDTDNLPESHPCKALGQFCYPYGSYMWLDPGAPAVANHTYNVLMDVAKRYDVDGVHFDDYFYPYPVDGVEFPDEATYGDYVSGGGTLELADWRRDNVNRLVQRIHVGLNSEAPGVKFTIAPFGIYRPCHPDGMPCDIKGFDQYSQLFADPKLWLQMGWLDALVPQLYWRIDPPDQSYTALLDWWTRADVNPLRRHVYAGNALYRIEGDDWPVDELKRQIDESRARSLQLSLGNVQFSFRHFQENHKNLTNVFRHEIYDERAAVPEMPWLPVDRTGRRSGSADRRKIL